MFKRLCIITLFSVCLLLPAPGFANSEPMVQITVQKDDTLSDICSKYLENPNQWKNIARINTLKNPDLIFPGQVINIPAHLLKGLPVSGTVNFIKGTVDVQPTGSNLWKPLHLKDQVGEGSKIRTGKDGIVEIVFEDGNSFLQNTDTALGITTAQKKGGDFTSYRLFLDMGRAITKIKKATGKETRYEIDTPSAICAVRGTVFRTSVDPENATRSEVIEGNLDVEAMKEKVRLEKDQGTLVKKGEPPLQPRKLLPPPASRDMKDAYKKFPVVFSFDKVEGAASYRVILAKEGGMKDIVHDQVIKAQENFVVYSLADGTYFLQASSRDDILLEGPPSDPLSVKVRINPAPPMVESPVEQKVYTGRELKLKWLTVEDAVRYAIQVSEDKDFSRLIENRDDLKHAEHVLQKLDYKTYYFRISSIAADGYQGDWSDVLSFSIVPETK